MAAKYGSSSSSDIDSDEDCCRRTSPSVPCMSSDWKKDDLSDIGVSYHKRASSLQDLMSRIKLDAKYRYVDLPEVCEKLIEFTNEVWTLSLDLQESTRDNLFVALQETDILMKRLNSKQSDLRKLLPETSDESIFEVWRANLLCFLANLKRLLSRWGRPGQREASFTHLFMLFSKICLLDPELGKAYTGCTRVKGVHVDSVPDIRFNTLPHEGQLMVAVATQVRQYETLTEEFSEETFCAENIASDVLGRHGIELLVEAHDSYFAPRVAGMMCIGTKVIFTYLDISRTHLTNLEENNTDGLTSNILYTRPYDFMDFGDRKEMLKALFWFGFVQTGAYKLYR